MKFTISLRSQISVIIFSALFFSFNFFTACKHNKAENIEDKITAPKDDIAFQNDMIIVLEEFVKAIPSSKIDSIKYTNWSAVVKEFYAKNNYKSLWVSKEILSPKGKEMLDFVGTYEFLGLNKDLYHYQKLLQLVDTLTKLQPNIDFHLLKQLETNLTSSFLHIALQTFLSERFKPG